MPSKRFKAHSLIQFTGSLSQFEIIALRSTGWACLRVCNLWKLDFMRLIVYGSIHDCATFVWKGIGSKPQRVFRVLGKVEYQIYVRLTCRVLIRVVEAVTVFGIRLTCQVEELVLVPDVFQDFQMFNV